MDNYLPERPISDALSETTKAERRSLLIANVVAAAVLYGRLIPIRISAFGVEVQNVSARSLALLLIGIVLYLFVTFALYAWADVRSYFRDARPLFLALAEEFVGPRVRAYAKLRASEPGFNVDEARIEKIVDDFLTEGLRGQLADDLVRAMRPYLVRLIFDVGFPVFLTINNFIGIIYVGFHTNWLFR